MLGGGPEFSIADGNGNVFVNLEDKSELLRTTGPAILDLQCPGIDAQHGMRCRQSSRVSRLPQPRDGRRR